jgi:GrpB-like predicted nucleotidyltransferase (UPF0157 family)
LLTLWLIARIAHVGSGPGGASCRVTDGRRNAHLHVMTPDSPRWHQQIAFRDALRANPGLTADYADLKSVLAAKHTDDRAAYGAAKTGFIETVSDQST